MTIFSLLLSAFPVFGASKKETPSVSELIRSINPAKEKIAVTAVRADTGQLLFSHQSKQPMIPASNMKLIVSAAALHYLGPNYAFETRVGLLDGNLVVIGGGDPLLGEPGLHGPKADSIFEQIAQDLLDREIKVLDDVILDDTFFDSNRVHPQWPADQLNRWYACEVSGLNFHRNCIRMNVRRGSGGAIIDIEPSTQYVKIVNQVKLVSSGSSAVGAYRNRIPNVLTVRGNLNQSAGFDVAIENPAGFFGTLLTEKLAQKGIEVRGKLIQKYVKNDPGIQTIRVFRTPLSEVLNRSNKDSLGLAAEALVKTISAENTQGRINGEWPHGLHLVGRYLLSLGIPEDEFVLKDGSGLSRDNRLSSNAIVRVLRDMSAKPYRQMFENSLSQGGVDGTAERYFRDPPYKGKIAGKTGYISGVRSFSGICRTPQGDYLFSILTEGGSSEMRNKINDITRAIFDGRW
ncbi:MAG: D-alanyl-D-alanine carboxypeptidase/D-alanyl-D-alanine-endopeptidase [Anaerohalosphaeraceae bacterium]